MMLGMQQQDHPLLGELRGSELLTRQPGPGQHRATVQG